MQKALSESNLVQPKALIIGKTAAQTSHTTGKNGIRFLKKDVEKKDTIVVSKVLLNRF